MQTVNSSPSRDLIRRGPFARLWWSQVVSSLGDWGALFASFALAARIAGGGPLASLGILVPLVARILPGLVFGVVGGVIADRWDRKRTMAVTDLGRAVLVGVLAFADNFRALFVLTFLIELLSLARQPAREAVVPNLVSEDRLLAANGLNLLAGYGTAPLGSALFALLVQLGSRLPHFGSFGRSIASAFLIDAVTFVFAGLVVLTVPIPKVEVKRRSVAVRGLDWRAPLRDVGEGLRFVARSGEVRRIILGMAAGLFGGGALFVIGQPFAEQVLAADNAGYGLIVTSLGVGVGFGMMAVTLFGKTAERRQLVFALSLVGTGVAIMFTAFTYTVVGAAGWTFITGFGTGAGYVTGFTHLHARVADDFRGRTFAALYALVRTALLASFALAGVGAAALEGVLPGLLSQGLRAVVALGGMVVLVSGVITLWASRADLRPPPFDRESLETLRQAGDTIGWMRGHGEKQ
jgi:dTMP kinase